MEAYGKTAANSPQQIQFRKLQDTLRIVGMGTLVFSLWTLAKYAGIIFFRRAEILAFIRDKTGEQGLELSDGQILILVAAVAGVYLAIILLFRVFVGLSAIREAKGKQKTSLYIVMGMLAAYSNLASMIMMILILIGKETEERGLLYQMTEEASVSSVIIELTSMIVMIEMIVSAIRIRKLRKKNAVDQRLVESHAA